MVESWKLSPPESGFAEGGIRTHEARRVAALVYEKPLQEASLPDSTF